MDGVEKMARREKETVGAVSEKYIARFADMLARRFGLEDAMAVRRYIVAEG